MKVGTAVCFVEAGVMVTDGVDVTMSPLTASKRHTT